jgi:tetrahydromethanopterin S-methyltransferase subunit A
LRKLPWVCEVKGHCTCKEMLVIPVNRVVDKKTIIGKKWRAKEEEERHKGLVTIEILVLA